MILQSFLAGYLLTYTGWHSYRLKMVITVKFVSFDIIANNAGASKVDHLDLSSLPFWTTVTHLVCTRMILYFFMQ